MSEEEKIIEFGLQCDELCTGLFDLIGEYTPRVIVSVLAETIRGVALLQPDPEGAIKQVIFMLERKDE